MADEDLSTAPELEPAALGAGLNLSPAQSARAGLTWQDAMIASLEARRQRNEAESRAARAETAKLTAAAKERASQNEPGIRAKEDRLSGIVNRQVDVPKPTEMPEAPQFGIQPQEMMKTMALITALSAIGGMATRQPLTAMLNNFAEGVNGYAQGNMLAYKNSMTEFKANFDKAKEASNQRWQQFQATLEKNKGDAQGILNDLKIDAAREGRAAELEALERGDWKSVIDMNEKANLQINAQEAKIHEVALRAREQADVRIQADQTRRDIAAQADQTRRDIAAQASADRQERMEDARKAAEAKGLTIGKDAQGNLVVIDPKTNTVTPFTGDTKGIERLSASGAARGGSAAQNRMMRVMAIDVDNAEFNFSKLAEMSKERGSLIGGSKVFANKFQGNWTADLKRYIETGQVDPDLQGADALLMNLAFDIASGQSGGTGQLAQAKIAEVENQMPLDSMPEDVKKLRYAALFHRVKAINRQLPKESQVDLSKYEKTFGGMESKLPRADVGEQVFTDKAGNRAVKRDGQWVEVQ